MRHPLTIAFSLLALPAPVLAADDFSGAWIAWLCPSGVQRDSGKCANFVLELHQKDGRLCGAHFFSTAGAERVDEGTPPSVLGDIENDVARVIAVSTRATPPVTVRVEMKKSNGVLQWLRLDNPSGDYLLPQTTRLSRSKSRTLFAPVFEQELKAACLSAFTTAAQNAARQAQPPAVESAPGLEAPSGVPSAPP